MMHLQMIISAALLTTLAHGSRSDRGLLQARIAKLRSGRRLASTTLADEAELRRSHRRRLPGVDREFSKAMRDIVAYYEDSDAYTFCMKKGPEIYKRMQDPKAKFTNGTPESEVQVLITHLQSVSNKTRNEVVAALTYQSRDGKTTYTLNVENKGNGDFWLRESSSRGGSPAKFRKFTTLGREHGRNGRTCKCGGGLPEEFWVPGVKCSTCNKRWAGSHRTCKKKNNCSCYMFSVAQVAANFAMELRLSPADTNWNGHNENIRAFRVSRDGTKQPL